jgi:hypothetical protein
VFDMPSNLTISFVAAVCIIVEAGVIVALARRNLRSRNVIQATPEAAPTAQQ